MIPPKSGGDSHRRELTPVASPERKFRPDAKSRSVVKSASRAAGTRSVRVLQERVNAEFLGVIDVPVCFFGR